MENINIEMCIKEAITFLRVAEKLEDDEETFLGGIFPFVVNSSLACELFLKSIIMINSTQPHKIKEHELKVLFNKLPQEDQYQIRKSFGTRMKHDFDEIVEDMSDTFVKWRYAYECSGCIQINITGILTLAQVLNEHISEKYLVKIE